jgi:hypothetical protein
VSSLYVVDVDAPGNAGIVHFDDLTAPQAAKLFYSVWPSRKSARLRTALNKLIEQRTGRRSAAGSARDNVVQLVLPDAAD